MSCICIGMIPHKSKRGTEAMNRLKVYDGVPTPYDKVSNVAHTVLQQFSTCRSIIYSKLLKIRLLS